MKSGITGRGLSKPFKNYKSGEYPSARELTRMGRILNGAQGRNGVNVYVRESGLVVDGGPLNVIRPWTFTRRPENKLQCNGGPWEFVGKTTVRCNPTVETEDDTPKEGVTEPLIELSGGPYAVVCVETLWADYDDFQGYTVLTTEDPLLPPRSDDAIARCPLQAFLYDPVEETYSENMVYEDGLIQWATPL